MEHILTTIKLMRERGQISRTESAVLTTLYARGIVTAIRTADPEPPSEARWTNRVARYLDPRD